MDSGSGNISKATSVGNYLNLYLGQNQGVRLGDSVVVSRKAHARMPEKVVKGQIKILINKDAGKTYLDFVDMDQVVHIDVYHKDGDIDPRDVAKSIFWALDDHLLEEDPQLKYAEGERFRIVTDYANKIYLTTNGGKGLLYDLFQEKVSPYSEGEEGFDHVHILARFNRDEYNLIYVISEAVESVILASGVKLAKVRNISHGREKKQEENFAGNMKLPWKKFKGRMASQLPDKENVNELIMKLAEKFGGVEEIEEWMDCYSTNIFKRRGVEYQKKKWGDVEHYVEQLEELGIIEPGLTGRKLSKRGVFLQDYIIKHRIELETEIRRNMRKVPGSGANRFRKYGKSENKHSQVEFTNYNRTINNTEKNWSGNLAVPETVIQAKKNSFLRGDRQFTLQKEDLHFYDKKTYVPIDICLLIDASGSMAGEKRRAACFLAEHLLLSGKEKIAVVTFQEHTSEVVVPFTRNQKVLSKGLATIHPAGLTPLASGIMTALKLINSTRLRNPLLVLITDGIPNTPLWTMDAKADAITAAAQLKDTKIRFICIGVESNRIYLEKLSNKAGGSLYLVDDLNKENLINIVRHEKKAMSSSELQI
ncbi:MAG TPA: VWA domain-containing protein [Syntrophomonas sp.]|nr:VWA domain-containing protein [Syntrophomonas sp.]